MQIRFYKIFAILISLLNNLIFFLISRLTFFLSYVKMNKDYGYMEVAKIQNDKQRTKPRFSADYHTERPL